MMWCSRKGSLRDRARNFSCAALLLLGSQGAHAATPNVVGGQLVGAFNVEIGGSLFDLTLASGSCIDAFSGCNSVADFAFDNSFQAGLASQALLDQVFVDGPDGQFGSGLGGLVRTPYRIIVSNNFTNGFVTHFLADLTFDEIVSGVSIPPTLSAGPWAVWQPAQVPEPGSALLLGIGLTVMAAGRRSGV